MQFDNDKSLSDEIVAKRSIRLNIETHDSIAAEYDVAHVEIYNPVEQKRIAQDLKEIVAQIETNSKKPLVLDFGAGTGNLTHHLLDLNVNVLAADVSKKSLEQLELKVDAADQLQTSILNGVDLSQFADNTFDVVVTYSVLHHIPDYLRIIQEFLRVVKPGGIIFIDHEVCPLYWYKNQDYQQYLKELGGNFSENHLVELGIRLQAKFLLRWFKDLFSKILSLKSWSNLIKRKLTGIKNTPVQISDVHVFKNDHIEWDNIKNILLQRCEIINENDYLVCRERSEQPVVWQRWNSKCADMRMLAVRKT